MKFTHLHVHSHYSLLDGLAKIDELLDACQELGMDSLALTDHGNMYGVVEFFKKAKERKIKPLIGNEMYLTPESMHQKRPNIDNKRYHLVLIAKNEKGYRNLVYLTTKSYLEGFYYKPRIDKQILKKHAQGLIGMSACLVGEIPRAVLSGDIKRAEKLACEYQDIFGKGNFYLEIQDHPNIPEQKPTNRAVIKIARKLKIPLVATNDVHYAHAQDAEAQDVLMSIQTDKRLNEEGRLSMRDDDYSLRTADDMIQTFKNVPEAIDNTQEIVSKCNFEFKLGDIKLPYFEVPGKETPFGYLKKLCRKGLKKRTFSQPKKEIEKRLAYELDIIDKTGYAPYFLIVQDFINWAKEKNIVTGPGRGTAAGSIVSYLLNVTDINPLDYNLIFERFLNPERISMPDIDTDFADVRRDEVIQYVSEKYGQDHVAQIITFGTMAARAAVRDVGRALDMPYIFCDQTAKLIPFGLTLKEALRESSELSSHYNNTDAKRLIDMAQKLEGVVRHASTHACGVLITKDPLIKTVPCQHSTQSDQAIVSQFEMHTVEDLGFLKMDFLGLKTLTVVQNTLDQIKELTGGEISLEDIALDDSATFKLFQEANTTGVFQFESGGMKRYLKDLEPTVFGDLVAMTALYRPGPIELIPDFIERKHGHKKIEYLHPKLEPILARTYGICVYQEQLMQIARELGGFSMGEADVLRKAVAKKIKKLLDKQKEKLIQDMINNGIEANIAKNIWQTIEPFARYGFPQAHATCYALIAYRTAYLKAHHPTEFMSALMTSEQNDIDRIAFLVSECKELGIKVLPPDVNESAHDFSRADDKIIRFGLKAVKNVGHNVVEAIVSERKENGSYQTVTEFIERVSGLNKKSMESLIKCGALDKFGERNQLLQSLDRLLNFAKESQKAKEQGQINLFGKQAPVIMPSFQLAQAEPAVKKDLLNWEKELLGLYISEHPMIRWEGKIRRVVSRCCDIKEDQVGQLVKTGGVVSRVKKINTRSGAPMLFAEIEDLTGRIEAVVFPKTLEQTADAWQEDKIILVKGKLDNRDGSLKILCEGVKILE